jgi:undecaprenyl-diphosphatase
MYSIHAFILGVVQGLTEFLPVSSSGHLLAFHDFLGFDLADSLSFDAALHLGTLAALLAFFWRDVIGIVRGFFSSLRKWEVQTNQQQAFAWAVILGTIPAGIVGLALEDWIGKNLRSPWLVVVTLVIGAFGFWIAERWYAKQTPKQPLTLRRAIIVGLAQCVALIPGISRSGATIVAGLGVKLERGMAARFAFLVSLPVVAAAGTLKLRELLLADLTRSELTSIGIGVATSAIVGYVVIAFFLRFIQHRTLAVFAWYRLAAAAVLSLLLILR